MKDVSTWMPIYWQDWMKDTSGLSLQEQGAYFMLAKEYWNNRGPIKDDKTRIYRGCGAQSRSEKESINLVLETFFVHENGSYIHERIDEEIDNAMKNRDKKSNQTQAARDARWGNTESVTDSVTYRTTPTPTPIPPSTEKDTPLPPQPVDNSPMLPGVGVVSLGKLGSEAKSFRIELKLKDGDIEAARKAAPGWDIYVLMRVYDEGIVRRGAPSNPPAAFVAWCRSYTKGKPPD